MRLIGGTMGSPPERMPQPLNCPDGRSQKTPGESSHRPPIDVLVRRVYRTGVQTVERRGDRYFITIKNRTISSEWEVDVSTARRFYRKMKQESC